MSEGFMSGFLDAQQSGDQHAAALQGLALGQQQLQKGALELKTLELMQQRQQAYLQKLATLNRGAGGAGGPALSGQSSVAHQLSGMVYDMGDAARAAGLPEEALSLYEKGTTMEKNSAEIDAKEAEIQIKRADFTANGMKWALDAKDEKEYMHRINAVNMGFQSTFGVPSQYAGKPISRTQAQALVEQTESVTQRAQLKKDDAETRAANARARMEPVVEALTKQRTEESKAREAKLKKETGKQAADDKLRTRQNAAIDDVVKDVDHIVDLLNEDNVSTGLVGRGRRGIEYAEGVVHVGDPNKPQKRLSVAVSALLAKLPAALTSKDRSNADIRKQAHEMANILAPFTSLDDARTQMDELKQLLLAQREAQPVKGPEEGGETGTDAATDALIDKYLNPPGSK